MTFAPTSNIAVWILRVATEQKRYISNFSSMTSRGFTILETLAAMALTALLLLAVLKVIGSLSRGRSALAQQADNGAWREDLLDTVRYDLSNATAASFRPDGMTLVGHGSLGHKSLSRGLEPVNVVYEVSTIHGRRWLVRSQISRAGPSDDGWSELICADVQKFSVSPTGPFATLPGIISKDSKPDQAIPAIVSVLLDGPAGHSVSETLVLR